MRKDDSTYHLSNKLESISINNLTNKSKWDTFINDLNFKSINKFTDNISFSQITKHQLNSNDFFINVDSSPYSSSLDYCGNKKETLFIINAMSILDVVSHKNKVQLYNGNSIILPATEPFELNSTHRRQSTSFILNMNNICHQDDFSLFNDSYWKKLINLDSGLNINKIIHRLYNCRSDLLIEKARQLIIHSLAFEIESMKSNTSLMKNKTFTNDVLSIINENYKNSDFDLKHLSRLMGVSTRTIQKKMNDSGIKFLDILQNKRVQNLRELIITEGYYHSEILAMKAGFNSLATANNHFIKEYGISINKYKKNMR